MAAADDITYHLVTLTPAPPGLCRVRQQDNGTTDSFAEGERVAMVAGLQCTDGTGGTWPTVVLLTADELAPEVDGEYLELRGAPGVSTHTCADQDKLSSHVRAAAWWMCDGDAPPTTTTPVNPPTRTAHYPACLVHPDQPRTPAASPAAERPATRATTSVCLPIRWSCRRGRRHGRTREPTPPRPTAVTPTLDTTTTSRTWPDNSRE